MKHKLKGLISAATLFALAAPVLVLAQFDQTAGGETALPGGTIAGIVANIMKWLLMLVGIIGVIGFAISGILYLTAAGDEDKMKTAKNALTWSIIGVIVALLGLVILRAANSLLGGQSANF